MFMTRSPSTCAAFLAVFLCGAAATLGACSENTPEPVGSSSGTSGSSSGTSGTSSGTSGSSGTDAGAETGGSGIVNGCGAYFDKSAASADRSIVWDFDIIDGAKGCIKIKAGQTVTFTKPGGGGPPNFTTHPLVGAGGDKPSPFDSLDKSTGKVTFDKAGTFGFICNVHTSMKGAIFVEP